MPLFVSLWLIFASGCIPARVPDNLDHTPGPSVIVSGDWYWGDVFRARAPAGWRIITSESRVPQAVIFAAPENVAVIRLISGRVAAADVTMSGQRNTIQEIELADGKIVTSVLSAPDDQWATFEPIFERVRESVQISTPAH